MTAVTGIDFVALQCTDLQRAASFYRDVVGLPVAEQSPPNAVVFATTPIPFVRLPDPGLELPTPPGVGVALWVRADDAERVHDDLVQNGVEIVRSLAPGPSGKTFSFRDPEGYVVTVHDDG